MSAGGPVRLDAPRLRFAVLIGFFRGLNETLRDFIPIYFGQRSAKHVRDPRAFRIASLEKLLRVFCKAVLDLLCQSASRFFLPGEHLAGLCSRVGFARLLCPIGTATLRRCPSTDLHSMSRSSSNRCIRFLSYIPFPCCVGLGGGFGDRGAECLAAFYGQCAIVVIKQDSLARL